MTYCEYAQEPTGLSTTDLVRECIDRSTCPKSVFANPLIYETCFARQKFKKEGAPSITQSSKVQESAQPKKVFKRITTLTEKFSNLQCRNCQYQRSSYCWGQCSFNIWKKQSDW